MVVTHVPTPTCHSIKPFPPNRHPFTQLFSVSQKLYISLSSLLQLSIYLCLQTLSLSPKSLPPPCNLSPTLSKITPSSFSPPSSSSSSYPSSNGGTTITTKNFPLAPWVGPTSEKPSNSTLKTQIPSSLTVKIGTHIYTHTYKQHLCCVNVFVNIWECLCELGGACQNMYVLMSLTTYTIYRNRWKVHLWWFVWWRYGDIFKTNILGCPCVMISSPEAARTVLVTQAHLFKPTYPPSKERLIGPEAVFFQQGAYHSMLKKLVQASFLPSTIKHSVSHVEQIVIKMVPSWTNKTINTLQEMKKVSILFYYILHIIHLIQTHLSFY